MATRTKRPAPSRRRQPRGAAPSAAVDELMANLRHPHRDAIDALRRVVLGADPSISECVKWNAPSFRTTDDFATLHLRAKSGFAVIFHLGVRKRAMPQGGSWVSDPRGLLRWLADDRALLELADLADLERKRTAIEALVRAWIAHVGSAAAGAKRP